MNSQHHKEEIDQIRKHVKMLNLTGGVAICALTLAGALMMSDIFNTPVEPTGIDAVTMSYENESVSSKPSVNITDVFVPEVKNVHPEGTNRSGKPLISKHVPADKNTLAEELQSFEATCNEGAIVFNWVTLGGTKYAYEIEKTYDQVSYEVFSRAPQPEKKDGKNMYAVEETAPGGEAAFYRLRKVVGKGKYEYSEAIKVNCTDINAASATVDVFPNGNGAFRILINTAIAGSYKVTLSDVNETIVATEEFQAKSGNNEFILNSSSITRGNYILRVSNDSMVKEKKVLLK